MGRTPKEKLDYYSMDDGWIHDYKVRRFVRKAGFEGLGFYNYLLHEVYHQSYYIEYNDDFIFSAAEYGNVDEEQVVEWVEQMESVGLIKIIDSNGAKNITSKGIQKRYLFIRSSLRRAQDFVPETGLWLLKADENPISATKTKQKSNFEHKNDTEMRFLQTERKGKEKGKETKNDNEMETDNPVDIDLFVPSYNPAAERINKFLEQKIPMGVREYTWVSNVVEEFSEEKIMEAIGIGLKAKSEGRLKVPLLKYVAAILKRWYEERVIDEEEARLAEEKAEHMRPGVMTQQIQEMMHK